MPSSAADQDLNTQRNFHPSQAGRSGKNLSHRRNDIIQALEGFFCPASI